MKKILFTLGLLGICTLTNAQDFEKYNRMDGVNSVLITSEMFKLLTEIDFDSKDEETKEYIDLIESLNDIKILSSTNEKISKSLENDANAYVENKQLKKLASVSKDGDNTNFYYSPGSKKGYVSQLLMIFKGIKKGKKTTMLMDISGDIDLKKVSKLAKDLNVPEVDKLKEVEIK